MKNQEEPDKLVDEPERLSHEWHAREADESAAYYDRVQSSADDGDVERDLAAKLRQAAVDQELRAAAEDEVNRLEAVLSLEIARVADLEYMIEDLK